MFTRFSYALATAGLTAALLVSPSFAEDKKPAETPKEAAKPAAAGGEKVLVIISHTVADFDKWKPGYDSMQAERDKNGIKVVGVFRSIDNPNDVTILEETTDPVKLKALLNSPDLAEAMKKHGVTSKPDIRYLKENK